MNKTLIYEKLAESLISKPLSTFRSKQSCIKCVKEIVQMYEEEVMRKKMLDKPL